MVAVHPGAHPVLITRLIEEMISVVLRVCEMECAYGLSIAIGPMLYELVSGDARRLLHLLGCMDPFGRALGFPENADAKVLLRIARREGVDNFAAARPADRVFVSLAAKSGFRLKIVGRHVVVDAAWEQMYTVSKVINCEIQKW